jgi:soluble lytic murein transglycosylase
MIVVPKVLTIFALLLALSAPLLAQTDEGTALIRGIRVRSEGSLETAVTLLREAAGDKKSTICDYAQFEIGETYFKAGKYPLAVPEYNKVIAGHPQSLLVPRAYLMAGKSQLNTKNYPRAISSFRQLIEKYPEAREAAEARYLTAKTLQKEGKWKEAYLAYEETDLYHPLSYFGKKSRQEIKALKKAHRKNLPRFKASDEALYKKGMTYFEQDDFEMAANIFNRLAREYPKSKYISQAWLMLGRAEMQVSKGYKAAISDLERASRLDGRAYYYLGLAHGRRGNFDPAIASLKQVITRYPDSGLADDAAYWIAYYQELSGRGAQALLDYYALITNFPCSKNVPAAIWRIGRIYYWNGDFKNAATYLHLAQVYPPGEDSPRCYYFEAKALERQGNRAAALEAYKKLAERFDHTYYAYRAQEKLKGFGIASASPHPFAGASFSSALNRIDNKNEEELAAIMEIWEQTNGKTLEDESSIEARVHLEKYKNLMELGLTGYAADEARYLVNITSDTEKDSLQTRLGEVLIQSGNYRAPIRFADRKIKTAVLAGNAHVLSDKIWELAYPRGYWKVVSSKAGPYQIDPYLTLAVIREESRFNPRAVSRSGARGLMQIMPRTGRGIARDLNLSSYRTKKLFIPDTNVEMGVYYLSNLIKNFCNNEYLALAGYNGGPNKIKKYVKSWYNGDLALLDIDEFVESIPNRETRLYVQKVMGSYFEYKRIYSRKG